MTRSKSLAAAGVVLATSLLSATSARAQCAGGAGPVGNIGITLLECDCVIAPPTSAAEWRFSTQPRVLGLERGGPADGAVRVNDVIISVDGQTVMSPEGARALARVVPNRRVTLTVRRAGELRTVVVTPTAACPTDTRLLGAVAPVTNASGVVSVATPARVASAAPVRLRAAGQQPTVVRGVQIAPVPAQFAAWVGLAFSCTDCSVIRTDGETRWVFGSQPEVYSVEQGSPAYRAGIRRGDVLTHLDGRAITTADTGRRWASLKPGDAVRVTYARDGQSRSVTLRPVEPPSRAAQAVELNAARAVQLNALRASSVSSDSAAARLIREYGATAAQQRTQQQELTRQLLARSQAGTTEQRQALESLVREYEARQVELRARQEQQVQELLRLRQSQSLVLEGILQPTRAPTAEVRASGSGALALTRSAAAQQLRYSGTFGGNDIEVHGVGSVTVTEQDGELIITTRDATIRIRRPDRD
ncbi:hypothetical protein BH23GEM10_BH23GEM10_10310 [soil metagenome]